MLERAPRSGVSEWTPKNDIPEKVTCRKGLLGMVYRKGLLGMIYRKGLLGAVYRKGLLRTVY